MRPKSAAYDCVNAGRRLTFYVRALRPHMIIDSRIRMDALEWSMIPRLTRERIKRDLTYKNPAYSRAERLGFSTAHIPKEITTYIYSAENGFTAGRGEFYKIQQALLEIGVTDPPEILMQQRPLPRVRYVNTAFTLDERQTRCVDAAMRKRQGIILAATGSGKTDMIFKLIAERKQKTLIVVPRKVLAEQILSDLRTRLPDVSIGTLIGGKAVWGDVTVALERTALKHVNEASERFGMLIADEVHVAAAPMFQTLYNRFPFEYRYGFTGTMRRKDQMEFLIYATFGRLLERVTSHEIISAGRAVPVEPVIHDTHSVVPPEYHDLDAIKFSQAVNANLHADYARTLQVKDIIVSILERDPKARIAVASRYLHPLRVLLRELECEDARAIMITGQTKNQEEACQQIEKGESNVALATIPVFGTGINIPSLTDIILISPVFSNRLMIQQLRGRLMRTSAKKRCGKLHMLWDGNVFDPKKLESFLRIVRSS